MKAAFASAKILFIFVITLTISLNSQAGFWDRIFGSRNETTSGFSGGRVPNVPWKITKNWGPGDEVAFSQFVTSIYESNCNSVPNCMAGSGNWYKDKDPKSMIWYADCGRFPYLLRSYFAFHNGLPFQAALEAEKVDPNDPNSEVRYSAHGNFISKRWAAKDGQSGYQFILDAVEGVYSAVFRVSSRFDVDSDKYSDFYHVALDRKYIHPGTIVYDPNGHVATVAKVTDDGKIILLDSHPDNTVSRVIYTAAFMATNVAQGGGFKNWREISYVSGKSIATSNAKSVGYSLEQFVGDQPNPNAAFSQAKWSTSEGILPSSRYMDVVRARLSVGAVKYHPLDEMKSDIGNLCLMMKDRIDSVQAAIAKGIDKRSMPNGTLPGNIYGTSGEWEDDSTPSRDARLKTAVAEFYSDMVRIYNLYKAHDPKVVYDGTDLVGDLLNVFDQASAACQMTYTKSDGRKQGLDFHEFTLRLYAMSFDPYQCVEQRMGASNNTELASCQQSSDKDAWYAAEQHLRNSLNRPYDANMAWTLQDLQQGADVKAGVGVTTQTPVDIYAFLKSVR